MGGVAHTYAHLYAPVTGGGYATCLSIENLDSEISYNKANAHKNDMAWRKKDKSGGSDDSAKQKVFHWIKKRKC
jgi:hypothetical protein